jgi:hypothetical protein
VTTFSTASRAHLRRATPTAGTGNASWREQPCESGSAECRIGPSSVKGTTRSFLTASQKGSSGPTLERRSLCRPSGPDGKGQARGQARYTRDEPPQG